MADRIDTVNEFMFATFIAEGIQDTTDNRIAFLQGLLKAWAEDPCEPGEDRLGKLLYQIRVASEIMRLRCLPDYIRDS